MLFLQRVSNIGHRMWSKRLNHNAFKTRTLSARGLTLISCCCCNHAKSDDDHCEVDSDDDVGDGNASSNRKKLLSANGFKIFLIVVRLECCTFAFTKRVFAPMNFNDLYGRLQNEKRALSFQQQ